MLAITHNLPKATSTKSRWQASWRMPLPEHGQQEITPSAVATSLSLLKKSVTNTVNGVS